LRLDLLNVGHLPEMFDATADENEVIAAENEAHREQQAVVGGELHQRFGEHGIGQHRAADRPDNLRGNVSSDLHHRYRDHYDALRRGRHVLRDRPRHQARRLRHHLGNEQFGQCVLRSQRLLHRVRELGRPHHDRHRSQERVGVWLPELSHPLTHRSRSGSKTRQRPSRPKPTQALRSRSEGVYLPRHR